MENKVKWKELKNQKQWKEHLINLLLSNDKAVVKAVIQLYDSQSEQEKIIDYPLTHDKVGFTIVDARPLGIIARRFKKGKFYHNDIIQARHKVQKYWRQLMVLSKAKIKEQEKIEVELELLNSIKSEAQGMSQVTIEDIIKCQESGISCNYGICDECNHRIVPDDSC